MRRFLLPALLALATASAHAQWAEVYANLAVAPVKNAELSPYSSTQYTSFTPVGVNVGATVNFLNFKPVAAGIDTSFTAGSTAKFWLAGIRIMAKPPIIRIKPSFRLSVGEAYLHPSGTYNVTPFGPETINYSVYIYNAALAADYPVMHFIDARVEVGDGRTLGAGSANPTNLLTINAGLVAHF